MISTPIPAIISYDYDPAFDFSFRPLLLALHFSEKPGRKKGRNPRLLPALVKGRVGEGIQRLLSEGCSAFDHVSDPQPASFLGD
jgi:hypothetical protein